MFSLHHTEKGCSVWRGVLGLAALSREQICWSVSVLHGRSGKGCCCGKKADEEDNQEKACLGCVSGYHAVQFCCNSSLPVAYTSGERQTSKKSFWSCQQVLFALIRVSIGSGEHPWDAKGNVCSCPVLFWVVKQLVVSKALNSRGAEPASATSCLVMSVGLLTSLFCLARLTSTGAGHNCPWWIYCCQEVLDGPM